MWDHLRQSRAASTSAGVLAGERPTEVKKPMLGNTSSVIHVVKYEREGSSAENASLSVIWVLILHNSSKDYRRHAAFLNDLLSPRSRFIAGV